MSAAELRAELKKMRKAHPDHAPVSKMKKGDVSDLIQRMKLQLEETPPVAALHGAPPPSVPHVAIETHKHAADIHSDSSAAHTPSKMAPKKRKATVKKTKAPKMAPAKNVVAAAVAADKAEHADKKGRPAKGSEEAKAKMAAIRMSKMKKAE